MNSREKALIGAALLIGRVSASVCRGPSAAVVVVISLLLFASAVWPKR